MWHIVSGLQPLLFDSPASVAIIFTAVDPVVIWLTACATSPLQRFSPATVPQCTTFIASFTAEQSQKEIIHLSLCISGIWMNLWLLQLNKWLFCILEKTVAKVPTESFTSLPAFFNHPFVVATTGGGWAFLSFLCHSLGRQPVVSVTNTNVLVRVDCPKFTEVYVEETTKFLSWSTCLNLLWPFCRHI